MYFLSPKGDNNSINQTLYMKCPISYSKEEILAEIDAKGATLHKMLNTVLQELCTCKSFDNMVKSFVRARGGNTEDAEDLIQESLSQLAISLMTKKYKGDSSIENYAFGICKFKWMNVMTKRGISTVGITDDDKEKAGTDDIEGQFISEEMKASLWKVVSQVSGRCPDFLKLWASGFSHREIGEQLQVTEKRARKNTSECRKRLRDLIRQNPQYQVMLQAF